jgi:carbon storage regulator
MARVKRAKAKSPTTRIEVCFFALSFSRRRFAMLVLTRKPGEKIHIGTGILITVAHVKGNKVRIGIEAPADVPVLRGELSDFLATQAPESRSLEEAS